MIIFFVTASNGVEKSQLILLTTVSMVLLLATVGTVCGDESLQEHLSKGVGLLSQALFQLVTVQTHHGKVSHRGKAEHLSRQLPKNFHLLTDTSNQESNVKSVENSKLCH